MNSHLRGLVDPFASDKKRFLIKAEHLMRYTFAKNYLKTNLKNLSLIYDFGAGTGYGVTILSEVSDKVAGFDQQKLFDRCTVVDFEKKVLSLDKADAIVCLETLEHMYNPLTLLFNVYKNLKDDGVFMCSIPQSKYDPKSKVRIYHHPHDYTITESIQLLNKAGFMVEKMYGQPLSNMIMRHAKNISLFMNSYCMSSKSSFELWSKIVSYPISCFYKYSYSVLYVCKKDTLLQRQSSKIEEL